MNLHEAQEFLNSKGYILEDNQELNEGILTIAGGVALGLLALKVVGKVLGVGLKGLSSILTQTNHQVILKVIDRDKDIISAELKEYMMADEGIAELIENKSITVKQIQEWIEKSSNKLIQPEFKANGLRMANDDMHDRQLKSRGFAGGISGGIDAHFENSKKLHEISGKLAQVVYDTIYEVKNESTIYEDTETQDDEYSALHRQYDDAIKDGPAKSDPLKKKKLKLYYKHQDLEDKIHNAYDFNIKSLFYGVQKELQKYYKKVDIEASDYNDEDNSQLVRYYFKYNKNSYMLEVLYYDEDGTIDMQLIDEDAIGADRDEFSITTIDKAIKHIVGFANYNAV